MTDVQTPTIGADLGWIFRPNNFGIQRELSANLLLEIAYVGNKGTKLPGLRDINAPAVITNPNGSQSVGPRPCSGFGDIQWMENRALSNYHSLQIGLEKGFLPDCQLLRATHGPRH